MSTILPGVENSSYIEPNGQSILTSKEEEYASYGEYAEYGNFTQYKPHRRVFI